MITIDETMVIHIINILFLIVIMNAILYKPIRTILAERDKKLQALGSDIDNFNKNAKLRQEDIERKLADARRTAKDKFEAARSEGQAAANESLGAIRSEVAAGKDAQLKAIKEEMAAARTQLQAQVEGFAADMAGKILGRSI